MRFLKGVNILHIDGGAGLIVGVSVFLLQEWISSLYQLPLSTIIFIALANVIYGIYAMSLVILNNTSIHFITTLVIANVAWAITCFSIMTFYFNSITLLGIAFIFLEAIFVCILSWVEWKNRFNILQPLNKCFFVENFFN